MPMSDKRATEGRQHQILSNAAPLKAAIHCETRDEPSGDREWCSMRAQTPRQLGSYDDARS